MKVGSGGDFVKMRGGAAGESAKKDIDAMIELLKKGWFRAGAFQTADCRKTFEELKAKGPKAWSSGVREFVSEPKDQFYGVEAVPNNPFGNWFSLTQPKNY
jgi:hypothetical protein